MNKQVFTGGIRTSWFNASWPFGRMTLTDDGLVIRTIGIVNARSIWPEVRKAERVVGGLLRSPGVRLTWADGSQMVFWSFNPEAVLSALKAHGVDVVSSDRPPKVWLQT